jgi:hypothetical protein
MEDGLLLALTGNQARKRNSGWCDRSWTCQGRKKQRMLVNAEDCVQSRGGKNVKKQADGSW